MLVLEDSKKSIEQAVTINGLTKLAFIFIPLNLFTSAFGINIKQLGTGSAEVWMLFTTLVVISTLVLVAIIVSLQYSIKPLKKFEVPGSEPTFDK
jgi:Mg2+ and Co2+ transporter CorA